MNFVWKHMRFIRLVTTTCACALVSWFIWPTLPVIPYCVISNDSSYEEIGWSNDGDLFFTATWRADDDYRRWQTWNMPSGQLQCDSGDLNERFWQVILDPRGRVVVGLRSKDYEVVIWNAKNGKEMARTELPVSNGEALSLGISPDGSTLVSAPLSGEDGHLRLWGVTDGKQRASLMGQYAPFAFSPDGKLLATTQREPDRPAKIRLWNLHSAHEVQTLDHRTSQPDDEIFNEAEYGFLAFSADSRQLGFCSTRWRLWDVATGGVVGGSQRNSVLPARVVYAASQGLSVHVGHATWEQFSTVSSERENNRHVLIHAATGEQRSDFAALGIPEPPDAWFRNEHMFSIKLCANRPYFAICENITQPTQWWERVLSHVGLDVDNSNGRIIRFYHVGTSRCMAMLRNKPLLGYSRDGQFFATTTDDSNKTNIYHLPPDRPWWYLIAGWLGVLTAVEVFAWIARQLARLFFVRFNY